MRKELDRRILDKEGAEILKRELGYDLIHRISYYIKALYSERPKKMLHQLNKSKSTNQQLGSSMLSKSSVPSDLKSPTKASKSSHPHGIAPPQDEKHKP